MKFPLKRDQKALGTQFIQDLTHEGLYGITRYMPKVDKIMRLHSTTNTIENGLVYLPEKASWLPEYLHELMTFPNGKSGFHIAGARLDQGSILGTRILYLDAVRRPQIYGRRR